MNDLASSVAGARLDDAGLDLIFRNARTHNAWLDRPVEPELLRRIYDVARMGPTSANCSPQRIVFVTSKEAKERLKPALSEGNRDKTMAAPVTAIFAYYLAFYEHLPRLFPHNPTARDWFAGKPHAEATAIVNGTLQAAYFMVTARAFGLDCGPMAGFDKAVVEQAFFPEGTWKSNFLCNLGYGDASKLFPRSPRLAFDEACKIL